MTPKEFAEIADKANKIREGSYDAEKGVYMIGRHEAVAQVAPPEWFWPIALFIFDGYCESSDWIEEMLTKEGATP